MPQLKYWNGSAWVDAVVGAQGLQGTQGTAGAQGTAGSTGTQGTQGTQGVQGTIGDPGQSTFIVAMSDESTSLTTGRKVTMRAPYAFTITGVRSSLSTSSSSGLVTVDINEGGASILSTKLSIDANERTSTTAATAAVISDTSIASDAELTFDIDAAGTGAKGLKVTIFHTKV